LECAMIAWEERLAAGDRLLDEMSRRIAHRGPDGLGKFVGGGDGVDGVPAVCLTGQGFSNCVAGL